MNVSISNKVSTPSMQYRVSGSNASGQTRVLPFATALKAFNEAKQLMAKGWTDVEVQKWSRKDSHFLTDNGTTQKLYAETDKPETQNVLSEDAQISIANLAETVRSMYAASKKGATDEQVSQFAHECIACLLECGLTVDDIFNMAEHISRA